MFPPTIRSNLLALALLLAGGVLVAVGLTAPAKGLPGQTALHPVRPELVTAGDQLFNWGLVGNGTLLLLVGAWAVCRRAPVTSDSPPLWQPPLGTENGVGRVPVWILAGLLLAALGLRAIELNSCLWYDEVVTLTEFVRLPYPELVRNYADQNQHPLYSVLARASVLTLGESAWALRLPAALFGAATLLVLYGFARRVALAPEPLLTAALLAVSYHHVWFSQNGRGYTLLVFWSLLGSWLLLENLHRPSVGWTVGYAVAMALALYTHLTAAFVLAAHGLVYVGLLGRREWTGHRLARRDWLPALGFVLTSTFALQLYALLLPQVVGSFRSHGGEGRVGPWTAPGWGLAQLASGLQLGFGGLLGVAFAGIVFLVGLLSYLRRCGVVVAFLILPCFLGIAVLLLLHRHLYPRFLFTIFPFALLVIVRGVMVTGSALSGRTRLGIRLGPAFAVLLLVVSAASLPSCYRCPKQDYSGALSYLNTARHPDDPVVTAGMAIVPVTRYFAPGVERIDTAEELAAVRRRNPDRPTWLVYTFPDHLKSFHPDVARLVESAFVPARSFPGTVGGGAVLVCRAAPVGATPSQASFHPALPTAVVGD